MGDRYQTGSRASRRRRGRTAITSSIAALIGTLLLLACTSGDDSPEATESPDASQATVVATATSVVSRRPTPAPTTRAPFILQTPTPFPTPEAMAPDRIAETNARRTGIPEVDRVISALLGDDPALLDSLVRAQSAVCHTEIRGLGDVEVCPEGVPEGTVVEFFVVGSCHGSPQHERPFLTPLDPQQSALYAVVSVPGPQRVDEHFPAGDQMLLFIVAGTLPSNVMGFIVDDGEVIQHVGGCGNTVATLLAQVGASPDYLLEPFLLPE